MQVTLSALPAARVRRTDRARRPAVLVSLVACAALALSSCGSSNGEESDPPAASDGASAAPTPAVAPPPGPRPTIEPKSGQPPAELRVTDLDVGPGPELAAGDMVWVQYVGGLWPDGEEFDSSWSRGEPFQFQLGAGMVIPGWDEGLVGMRLGGRRELVIPPSLAYGEQGTGSIPPNSTLIFVVDAVGQLAAEPAPEE